MWIDFLFLPGPRLTYDSVIRCAVKVIRFGGKKIKIAQNKQLFCDREAWVEPTVSLLTD